MNRPTSRLLVTGAAVAALLGAACGSSDDGNVAPEATASTTETAASDDTTGSARSGDVDVRIEDFVYVPAELTVEAGTTVTWMNEDFFGHTVTSGEPGDRTDTFDGVMGEVAQAEGTSFSFTFDEPGTYPYFCRFHPRMVGTITVTG